MTSRITKSKNVPKKLKGGSYHHGDLKEALVAAALDLVDRKGPKGFSLAEVCRQAGVSVAAPYRHFADKEALLAAVAQSGFLLFQAHLEESMRACENDPFESLRVLAVKYVEFARQNPSRFRVMFAADLQKSRFPELFATARNAFEVVLNTIERCGTARSRSENYILAVSVWAQCHGIAVLAVDGFLREISMEERINELIKLTLDRFIEDLAPSRHDEQELDA